MYQQNFGQPMFGGGYAYGARPAPKVTQPVTPELAKMLSENNDELDVRISNVDKIRNWCTHKEPGTGRLALIDNADGTVTCRVCGATFHLIDDLEKVAEETSTNAYDLLQTIKCVYVDIPEEFLKNYMQTISMISKFKDLAKRAQKNFSLYEGYTGNMYPNGNNINYFQAANNVLSGFNMFGGQPAYGNGMYPMYGQQPMQQPVPQYGQWAQPQQPMQPMQNPAAPAVDVYGNVIPTQGMPMAPTTIGGIPMAPGYNPLMATGMPGAMNAPAPTAMVTPQAPAAPDGLPVQEPTQTKQMTV